VSEPPTRAELIERYEPIGYIVGPPEQGGDLIGKKFVRILLYDRVVQIIATGTVKANLYKVLFYWDGTQSHVQVDWAFYGQYESTTDEAGIG